MRGVLEGTRANAEEDAIAAVEVSYEILQLLRMNCGRIYSYRQRSENRNCFGNTVLMIAWPVLAVDIIDLH
jgi:hypothetical protein